ncbi:hypothetical protein AB0D67_26090 [Streptosporangium sp. NPDC048047]|uniref:hypothetical protein n=1 Tax=unclassified Streptosporangium TaxID=2632669 RepID=UPI00341F7CB1
MELVEVPEHHEKICGEYDAAGGWEFRPGMAPHSKAISIRAARKVSGNAIR